MSLAPKLVRNRIQAQIDSVLGSSGWALSPYVFDSFDQTPRELWHLGYAVGLGQSVPSGSDSRQRHQGSSTVIGVMVATSVLVRFGHHIRADAQISDEGSALDAELALVAAVMGIAGDSGMRVTLDRIASRSTIGDGTQYRGEVQFQAWHRYAL